MKSAKVNCDWLVRIYTPAEYNLFMVPYLLIKLRKLLEHQNDMHQFYIKFDASTISTSCSQRATWKYIKAFVQDSRLTNWNRL